jgi:hypothetical protein
LANAAGPRTQFKYGFVLFKGDGILMSKSSAAHDLNLSVNQKFGSAEYLYAQL